ncbi:Oxygen-dependent choline dehydrogenase, partial [Leucoagaricus sp. SymC.cos]
VRYDIRGHGRSGKPTDPASYESKRFAEDFKAVVDGFKLNRPLFAGWSMGSNVVCDIAAHLPPAFISAAIYLSGIPATGELIGELASPGLVEALPGLLNGTDVNGWRSSGAIFTEKLFANPDAVPWSVKTMYLGNSLSPEIMALSLTRTMDVQKLWDAGKDGLPLIVVQGGSITLNSSDHLTHPTIDSNYFSTEFDRFAMHYIIKPLQLAGKPTDDEIDAYFCQAAGSIFHPVGTAAMTGEDAGFGVVNPYFKAKGVDGLRVVDGSILASFL